MCPDHNFPSRLDRRSYDPTKALSYLKTFFLRDSDGPTQTMVRNTYLKVYTKSVAMPGIIL